MMRGAEAERALDAWLAGPTLVLGIGHPWCGDDAAGPLVCAQAAAASIQAAAAYVIDCGDAPERFLGKAGDPEVARVLLVDAMEFDGAPGEVAFCPAGEELREGAGTTHTTGLAVLARFITTCYGKPVAVLGIQPVCARFGQGVSQAVQDTAARVGAAVAYKVTAAWEAAWTRS